MSEKKPNPIGEELEKKNRGEFTGNELVFDPETGELVVKPKDAAKPSADSTVLDQIAEDGFFKILR